MEENENSYRKVVMESDKKSSGFGKSVLVPFASGVIGATLVVGTCFGVPSIREKLMSNQKTEQIVSASPSSSEISSSSANLISLSNYSDTSIAVAAKVQPSVVGIKVEYNVSSIFYRQSSTASASGSGVIISEDGYILTNNHIVNTSSSSSFYQLSEATKVIVYLYGDDTEYEAEIVGTDSVTDLAVIKIDKTGLTPATLGNSDAVKVGEYTMAVGNPLGMQNSVTCGIVSAVNREVEDEDGKKYILIQTDAAINSGNSGGALANSKGEVIGINTLKLYGTGVEGLGFAIPINSTIDIANQLIQYNKVKRPYIGITGIDLDEDTAKKYNYPVGVYVRSVEDFSAAQKAEIKVGDVIVAVNGKEVKTMDEINEIKNTFQIGDEITLKVVREGKEMEFKITLTEQP
ncbi:MAG: trypsin-like peptidase domain-containing protein [Clostridia bacterium]|nr:trypsin-like peptidase domain-containing protein [Clostridia bacterium]